MYPNISIRTTRLEQQIAKLYLFFLPFRMIMPLEWLKIGIGPLADSFDLIFHIIGLMLWLRNKGGFTFAKSNIPMFSTLRRSIIMLNASSIIMASVISLLYGELHGESPFIAIIPMILYYFQYLFMFLYNIRVFTILDYKTITRQIKKTCTVLLCIAYVQILVMTGIGTGIYDLLASLFGGFVLSVNLSKLSLTMSEGAAAGCLMGVFVFPFIFARIIHGEKRSLYELLLWLLPLYFTNSSTAMILFCCCFIVFLFLESKKTGSTIVSFFGVCIILGLVGILLLSTGLLGNEAISSIGYLIFDKIGDQENGSTISRQVPLIIDWGCFTEMPILGVGNGLQGYFYNKYFPAEFLSIPGSDVGDFYDIVQKGIANGGCFWPGYISGYGIIGICILINIIIKMKRLLSQRSKNLGIYKEMFIMGAICFFPLGMQGEAYCLYFAWFVLSIPFMYFCDKEIKQKN